MSRLLRGIIAAAVVLLVIAGFWQWRGYSAKKELRDNALLYFKEQDFPRQSSIWRKLLTDILCWRAASIMI